MNTKYRITNDGGDFFPSRPWHVESQSPFTREWHRIACCETRESATRFIAIFMDDPGDDDALMLGGFDS